MATANYQAMSHDERDPSPWLALYLDQSLPIDPQAKVDLLDSTRSPARQYLLPFIRPIARISMMVIQVLRVVLPRAFASSRILHHSIYWGLRLFVRPEANRLILRHMHLGTEILEFVRSNAPSVDFEGSPLRPTSLADVKDDLFLRHDLNLFNFIIRLNRHLQSTDAELGEPGHVDFGCITDGPIELEAMPDSWHNVLDLESAIEIYTPLYQLLLSDSDFWRASHSLQLDETIAIYAARILGDPLPIALVNNRHPLLPMSTLRSGYRLMLHGLAAETLHALLRQRKRMALGSPGG